MRFPADPSCGGSIFSPLLPIFASMRRVALSVALLTALALPVSAPASELIARDATAVTLRVTAKGQALLGYTAKGKRWSVLVWGAVDAIHPTADRPQVRFRVDYSGGWGTYRRTVSRGFANACRPYSGPVLSWLVTGCTMPDGSYPGYPATGRRPEGRGERYRATLIGPGVTPDVTWEGPAPLEYDEALDRQRAEAQRTLYGADTRCKPV